MCMISDHLGALEVGQKVGRRAEGDAEVMRLGAQPAALRGVGGEETMRDVKTRRERKGWAPGIQVCEKEETKGIGK